MSDQTALPFRWEKYEDTYRVIDDGGGVHIAGYHEKLLIDALEAATDHPTEPRGDGYCGQCWLCFDRDGVHPYGYVLCQTCGNKRCPHAADHDLPCTRSNAPGQPGATRYPEAVPLRVESGPESQVSES